MTMTHPGLPAAWVAAVVVFALAAGVRAMATAGAPGAAGGRAGAGRIPVLSDLANAVAGNARLLVALQVLTVGFFLLIVGAGLFGSPYPERNIATVLTWNIWWAGLIVSVFFLGSAWCAICPWDALSRWLVGRRFSSRGSDANRINLRMPSALRNLWPAIILLGGLTWLELGYGITLDPYATAVLALAVVVVAVFALAVFERRAFCRYACPVGRTVGAYSQLAPIELRPVDTDVCARCTTLECYHGTEEVDPCPTHLVMGRLTQNTYCLSCGNCARSCPHGNVSWRARPPAREAMVSARPRWDEAWFMLLLLSLTLLHGLTMMPFWEAWVSGLGRILADSGRLLVSFSCLMIGAVAVPVAMYGLAVAASGRLGSNRTSFRERFAQFAFASLPLTFSYHLAHNLNHLVRESDSFRAVLANPFGWGTLPPSMAEQHARHMSMVIPEWMLFTLQGLLMMYGAWLAVKIVLRRSEGGRAEMVPMLVFVFSVLGAGLWLLNQPMVMRF